MQAPFIYMAEIKTLAYGCDGTFTKQPDNFWTSSDGRVRTVLELGNRRLIVIYPEGVKTVPLSDAAADVFIPVDPKATIEVLPVGGPQTLQSYIEQICKDKTPSVPPPVAPTPVGPTTYAISNAPRLREGENRNVRLVIATRKDGRTVQITYTGTVVVIPTPPTGYMLQLQLKQKGATDFPAKIEASTYVADLRPRELTFREVNGGREFVAQQMPDEVRYHEQLKILLRNPNATDAECKTELERLRKLAPQVGQTLDDVIKRKVAKIQQPAPDAELEKYRARLKILLRNPNATDAECKTELERLRKLAPQVGQTLDDVIKRKVAKIQQPAPDAELEKHRTELEFISNDDDNVSLMTLLTTLKAVPETVESYKTELPWIVVIGDDRREITDPAAKLAWLKQLATAVGKIAGVVIRYKYAKAVAEVEQYAVRLGYLGAATLTDQRDLLRRLKVEAQESKQALSTAIDQVTDEHLTHAPAIRTILKEPTAEPMRVTRKLLELRQLARQRGKSVEEVIREKFEKARVEEEARAPATSKPGPVARPKNFMEALAQTNASIRHAESTLAFGKASITLATFAAGSDDTLTDAIRQLATAAAAMGKGKRLFLITHTKQNADGELDTMDVRRYRGMVERVITERSLRRILPGTGVTDVQLRLGILPPDLASEKKYFTTAITVALVPKGVPFRTTQDTTKLYDAIMAHYGVTIDRGPIFGPGESAGDIGYPTFKEIEEAGYTAPEPKALHRLRLPEKAKVFRVPEWTSPPYAETNSTARQIADIGKFLKQYPLVDGVVVFWQAATMCPGAMAMQALREELRRYLPPAQVPRIEVIPTTQLVHAGRNGMEVVIVQKAADVDTVRSVRKACEMSREPGEITAADLKRFGFKETPEHEREGIALPAGAISLNVSFRVDPFTGAGKLPRQIAYQVGQAGKLIGSKMPTAGGVAIFLHPGSEVVPAVKDFSAIMDNAINIVRSISGLNMLPVAVVRTHFIDMHSMEGGAGNNATRMRIEFVVVKNAADLETVTQAYEKKSDALHQSRGGSGR